MADDVKKAMKKGAKDTLKEVAEERVPGFAKEMAATGRKAKAKKLTRLMRKGYRKGYRVGERPTGKRPSPFRKSSRKSGR